MITPTYTGCPATQVIERDIRAALDAAGFRDVAIETTLSPPWTTDWISESGQGEAPRLWHRPAAARRAARGRHARNAARPRPRRSAASARRRARRSGAAAPASSRSTCSSATDERRLPHPQRSPRWSPRRAEAHSIRFAVPEELRETFKFKPGQHLTLKAEIGGEEIRRNYSLCVAPQDDQVMVTVKRIAGGAFSNWANDNLKPGMAIEVMAPHGSFTWDFAAGRGQSLCRLRRRLRNHAGHVAAEDRLADRAGEPLHALLRQSRQQLDHLPGSAGAAQKSFHGSAASPSFPCRRGRGVRAVQRHARSRQMRRDPGEHWSIPPRSPPSSSAAPGR